MMAILSREVGDRQMIILVLVIWDCFFDRIANWSIDELRRDMRA